MPDLGKALFQGERNLTVKEISQCAASNSSDGVNTVLSKFGWNENLLGAGTILEFSPDNRHVARAAFLLRGPLAEEGVTIHAAKCWINASEDVVLHIKFPQADQFNFSSGGGFSEYLDSSHFEHSFHSVDEDGQQTDIDTTDLQENGVGAFCLRIVAYPVKAVKPRAGVLVKVNVLLFPKTSDELDELCDATRSPSWPGIRVLETESQFFPTVANGTWGCPLLPIVIPGANLIDCQNVPSGRELRHAIGGVLRHVARPEAHIKPQTLKAHWDNIIKEPTSLKSRTPEYTWPKTARAEPTPGKYIPYCTLVSLFSLCVASCTTHESRWHVVGQFLFNPSR